MLITLKLHQLRAALTVAEKGSLRAAARALGLFVPAATPRPVLLRLREAIDRIVVTPEFKERLAARSFSDFKQPDVEAFVKAEAKRWPPILADAGLKPQ